ncbi:DinB family protein [Amycolatopsis sp. NBC_01307]|uniref:DinB family protein n=1 Tax=Amycolatopsis sp. NBC_01307 TaxID=2903561 RepID=UPI002E122D4B|nr:DinB family protein [Amycolatopsis sp. NBC_01307]
MDGEKRTLLRYLHAQRAAVLAILEGLGEPALTTPVLPSGWTPLGMVEHLGYAERFWFQEIVTGTAGPVAWPDDDHAPLTTPRAPDVVFAFYREQCRRSDEIFAATPLDTPSKGRFPDLPEAEIADLRGVVLHVIEETARHAGQLDVVRELIDGRTGLGPR